CRNALRVKRATRYRLETRRVDAFDQTQSHQQELIGAFLAGESVVCDKSMTERLDAHQPAFGPPLGCGGAAHAFDVDPAMRAGTDAGVFVVAPVDEIVPALGARPRVVRYLVGR